MLVSAAQYRVHTLDTASSDGAVTGALVVAQQLVGEATSRELEYGQRTETLPIRFSPYKLPAVFPTHCPVVSVDTAGVTAETTAILVGVAPDNAEIFGRVDEQVATVTYWGGWTTDTVPAGIVRAISLVAKALLQGPPNPTGAKRVTNGDVTVEFPAATRDVDELVPGLGARLRKWDRSR